MDGDKIAVDPQGFMYLETGNGTFDTAFDAQGFPANGDYGDSFVKLAADPGTDEAHPNANGWGLKVADYFTPADQLYLQANDLDLGSGGAIVLPDAVGSAAHPHLLIGSGKQGILYLIDRDNMGKYDPAADHVVEATYGVLPASFDTPAYYDGTIYYVAAFGATAETLSIEDGAVSLLPTSLSGDPFSYPGSTPSISSNGDADGIVWDIDYATSQLRAYSASSYGDELYTSDQAGPRDALGPAVKFSVPTVADGRVYVGTQNALVIYGLRAELKPPPAISDLSLQSFGAAIALQWTPLPAATAYYVYRATDAGAEGTAPLAGPITGTAFTDSSAVPGRVYYYQVTAINAAGEGDRSEEAYAVPLLPDLDDDGTVGFSDLLILAQHYGQKSQVNFSDGDLNGDGVVDFGDLLILAQHYGWSDDAFAQQRVRLAVLQRRPRG
jgi:hypothetical protein